MKCQDNVSRIFEMVFYSCLDAVLHVTLCMQKTKIVLLMYTYATMNKMSSEKCLIQFLVILLSLVSWSLEFTIHKLFVNSSEFLFYQSIYENF